MIRAYIEMIPWFMLQEKFTCHWFDSFQFKIQIQIHHLAGFMGFSELVRNIIGA